MMVKQPLIAVVDDDESVRESLPDLLHQELSCRDLTALSIVRDVDCRPDHQS